MITSQWCFKKARLPYNDFRIMGMKETDDNVWTLHIRFKHTDQYGLAVWDDNTKKFLSQPRTYLYLETDQDEVERRFGFVHTGKPLFKDNGKYLITKDSIILGMGCIVDFEVLVHEILFNILLQNPHISLEQSKTIFKEKREVLKIDKPITIKIK